MLKFEQYLNEAAEKPFGSYVLEIGELKKMIADPKYIGHDPKNGAGKSAHHFQYVKNKKAEWDGVRCREYYFKHLYNNRLYKVYIDTTNNKIYSVTKNDWVPFTGDKKLTTIKLNQKH